MTNQTVVADSPTTLAAAHRSGAKFLPSTIAVAKRTVRKFVRTPQLIGYTTVQSVVFLLIFRYIFGGAIEVNGQSYVDFLVPGFITTAVLFAGMSAAVGVAEDFERGFFDRLRSLPVPRLSVIAGRCLADTILVIWALAVATVLGFAVGFRLDGTAAEGLAAFGLCVVYGFAFAWLFITIGLVSGGAQAAQGMSMLVFPLVFVSSAYIPVDSMPGWMQAFADYQPITPMVDAVRSLTGGPQAQAMLEHGTSHYVGVSLIWSAGIVVVFAALSVARFNRR
jgi:ABC transporter DrrB family efflux protein